MKSKLIIQTTLALLICANASGQTPGTPLYETEPNNSLLTANQFTNTFSVGSFNSTIFVQGNVGGINDPVDYYEVTTQNLPQYDFGGGPYLFSTIHETSSDAVNYNVSQTALGRRVDENGNESEEEFDANPGSLNETIVTSGFRQTFARTGEESVSSFYRDRHNIGLFQPASWSPPTVAGQIVTVTGVETGMTGEYAVFSNEGQEVARGYVSFGVETSFTFSENGLYFMVFSRRNGLLIGDYDRPQNDPLRDPDGSYLKYGYGTGYIITGDSSPLYANVTVNGVRRTTDVPLAFAVGVVPEPATIIALSLGLAATLRKRKSE